MSQSPRAMLVLAILSMFSSPVTAAGPKVAVVEGGLEAFLGEPKFERQELFEGERFPNVVAAADGSLLATWGSKTFQVRRSDDGGKTWSQPITIGKGIVDEKGGDVLLFTHPEHPARDGTTAPRTMYRSSDHGKTWKADEAVFEKDANGFIPSLHMSEHGVTLRHGKHAGRLIRPARVYQTTPQRYSTTIYSDDAGRTFKAGEPVPIQGSGEGALLELSDGRLIYSARRSYFAEGQALRHERHYAISDDGGMTWRDTSLHGALPDGPRFRAKERRGANYNGHFGMLAGFMRLPVKGHDILLYSNADHDGHERVRLTVWASFDGGKTWPVKRLVDEGLSAYSSLTAGRPGTPSEGWIYLQYEYGKDGQQYAGGRLARFNLSWLLAGQPTGDGELPAARAVEPVKVFILAGQSNMQGQGVVSMDHPEHYNGGKGNLVWSMEHSASKEQMRHLRDADGRWVERDDVTVWYKQRDKVRQGKLTVGYTGYGGSTHIGPELQFGHIVGDTFKEHVLIIKTAWGGKSLQVDFRPPSAGGDTGPYYKQMIAEVREALASLEDRPYELAGFVWMQGWNDMINKEATDEYADNLVHLARDIRAEFKSPKLPIVVGELGNMGEAKAGSGMERFRAQQKRGAAGIDRCVFVPTHTFARDKDLSPNRGHGHHWFGNAESYFLIGDALGKAMVKLLEERK